MKIIDYALAGGFVVTILALIWVLRGVVERIKDEKLKRDGRRVIGTVVGLFGHLEDTELEIGEQRLDVEYEIDGKKKSVYSKTSSYGWDGWVGKKLAVWHFPNKPDGARLELDMRASISMCIRIAVLVAAAAIFIFNWDSKEDWST